MPWTSRRRRIAIATAAGLVLFVAGALIVRKRVRTETVTLLNGAIIAQNQDPHLQRPIGNATITAISELGGGKAISESSGLFRLRLDSPVAAGTIIEVRVEHPDYYPFAVVTPAVDQIHLFRLTPKVQPAHISSVSQETRLTNIRVRYATRNISTTTVGTAVRTFDVSNTGNVPCAGKQPCSPDGKWKASVRSFSLDTGENDKQFRNARVSCIAGPCPFSRIDVDRFSRGGRTISVTVRNWSDPVMYLLEAEVVLTMESELVRHTYPVTFGRSMNFTLPAAATGPSIEAEVNGSEIVFPLGPELRLSWATCRFETGTEGTKQYRCELKPGYSFE